MTQTYKVQVSMNQAHIVESGFVWKQGDFGFNIEIEVLDFDTTGATPQIIFRKSSGAVEATQISVAGNKFTYAIRGTELDTPGPCVCDLKLKDSTTKRVSTASFKYFVIPDTMDGLEQEASSYSDTIEQIIEEYGAEVATINGNIAPEYSASTTYNEGDYVIYNNSLYRSNGAITSPESWTPEHWSQVAISEDTADLKTNLNFNYPQNPFWGKTIDLSFVKGRKMIIVSGTVSYADLTGCKYCIVALSDIPNGLLIKYSDFTNLAASVDNRMIALIGSPTLPAASIDYLSANNIRLGYKGITKFNEENGTLVIDKDAIIASYPSTSHIVINAYYADSFNEPVYISQYSLADMTEDIYSKYNILGDEPNVLYPCFAPAGSSFKAVTFMEQPLSDSVQILLYNASKTQVDYFGLVAGVNSRTYTCPAAKGEIRYIAISAKPSSPVQVEISTAATYSDFQFRKLTVGLFSEYVRELTEQINKKDAQSLPDFVISAGNETYKRIMEWADSEPFAMIAQVTDVHSAGTDKYKAVGYLNGLNALYGFDLIGNFGDIGLDTPSETTENGWELVENTKSMMDTTTPWVFLRGNHDHGRILRLTNGDLSNIFEMPFAKQNHYMKETGECYGYIDLELLKIRVVYVNTSDDQYYGGYALTAAQLSWIAETLSQIQSGWDVVIISHMCVDSCGRWTSYPEDADGDDFDTFRSIMAAFVAKTAGSNSATGVSWDFTAVPSECKLICNFAGDSHFNNTAVTNGVRYIVRQGYGGIPTEDIAAGGTFDSFDYNTQCLFDILCIKKDGTAGVFRIGAGGSTRDLEFSY